MRSFGSFTQELHRLADWLSACGVRSVAMEATGVYWIPLYEILEARGFEVLLVDARHVKNVPGRKSDVSDAEWLRDLHRGCCAAAFAPRISSWRCAAICVTARWWRAWPMSFGACTRRCCR